MTVLRFNSVKAIDTGEEIILNITIPRRFKNAVQGILDGFKDIFQYEIKRYREKRSVSANAYFWKLADELSMVLGITKEEVYKRAIYHAGKFQILEAVNEEVAQTFCKRWCMNGLGWYAYCDKIKPKTIYMYYGSSVYNTKEMSRIIDYLVDECKRQNIETRPKDEVDAMLREWEKEHG